MENYGFRRPIDDDLGVNSIEYSTTELLSKLLEDWKIRGKKEDIEDASKILSLLKNNEDASLSFYTNSLFGTMNNKNDLASNISLEETFEKSIGFHVDLSGSHTTRRLEAKQEFDYQYRICINNSSDISYSDIILFTMKFEQLCKERNLPLNIKVIPDERDVFICYCKEEHLSSYVQILSDMESNKVEKEINLITKKFGRKKPFTSSISDSSYFGISSGLFKNETTSVMKGTMPVGDTMTGYSARLSENAYNTLLKKYNSDITKITVEDFYIEMHKEHIRRQFPDKVVKSKFFGKEIIPSELLDIPFWMNEHAYNMVYNNNLKFGARSR